VQLCCLLCLCLSRKRQASGLSKGCSVSHVDEAKLRWASGHRKMRVQQPSRHKKVEEPEWRKRYGTCQRWAWLPNRGSRCDAGVMQKDVGSKNGIASHSPIRLGHSTGNNPALGSCTHQRRAHDCFLSRFSMPPRPTCSCAWQHLASSTWHVTGFRASGYDSLCAVHASRRWRQASSDPAH
jgi:hypothetical protein